MDDMDSNMNLLGFNNGVYELDTGKFRPAKPEDRVSMTTRYDYEKCDQTETRKFLSELIPNPDLLHRWLIFLASCLSGNSDDKRQLTIITGHDCTGKSIMRQLIAKTFGDYCGYTICTRMGFHDNEMKRLVFLFYEILDERLVHDLVKYNKLYNSPDRFTPRFKLILLNDDNPDYRPPINFTEFNFTTRITDNPTGDELKMREIDTSSMKLAFMSILLEYINAANKIKSFWRAARFNPRCDIGRNRIKRCCVKN